MRDQNHQAPREQTGQSTVEFMLMIPVIFALFFFVIEMGLYFSAVHYTQYATYATARAKMVNYRVFNGQSLTSEQVAGLIMTGSALRNNYTVTESEGGIQLKLQSWKTNFPYLSALMPNMPFATTVNLGPNEGDYESRAFEGCADNDMNYDPC